MTTSAREGTASGRVLRRYDAARRWAAWFHELDAWTEYWDVYHPETRGRYYFGDDVGEPGLLSLLLPRATRPAAFVTWSRMVWATGTVQAFVDAVRRPPVAAAVVEVDALVARLFASHFGDARDPSVRADYLDAMFRFAADTLPRAAERDARVPADDPRKATAGRHTLDGDLMWFAWALHTEAAFEILGTDEQHERRCLMLAGVAMGCPVNFAWRGHRRTRSEYHRDTQTVALLRERGLQWALDFGAARQEIHALFRIREYGDDGEL